MAAGKDNPKRGRPSRSFREKLDVVAIVRGHQRMRADGTTNISLAEACRIAERELLERGLIARQKRGAAYSRPGNATREAVRLAVRNYLEPLQRFQSNELRAIGTDAKAVGAQKALTAEQRLACESAIRKWAQHVGVDLSQLDKRARK